TADLVDRRAADAGRQAGAEGSLARGRLAKVCRQHAAHDYFADLGSWYTGLFERRLHGGGAQLRAGNPGELAQERTDGRALGPGNDNTDIRHGGSGLTLWGRLPLQLRPSIIAVAPDGGKSAAVTSACRKLPASLLFRCAKMAASGRWLVAGIAFDLGASHAVFSSVDTSAGRRVVRGHRACPGRLRRRRGLCQTDDHRDTAAHEPGHAANHALASAPAAAARCATGDHRCVCGPRPRL